MYGYSGVMAATAYHHGQVDHADPVRLVVMLYDGAMVRLRQATQEMAKGSQLASGIAIYRGLAILAELRRSLNVVDGGEIAAQLDHLYEFMHGELVKGNLDRRPERIERVLAILAELREAWDQVAKAAKGTVDVRPAVEAEAEPGGSPVFHAPLPDLAPALAIKA